MNEIDGNEEIYSPIGVGDDNDLLDKYTVLKDFTNVKSSIKNFISSDFVLAKLDDQDKTGISDMVSLALYCSNMILMTKLEREYYFDHDNFCWKVRPLSRRELREIDMWAEALFNSFMKMPYMTVILNRNKGGNKLVEQIIGRIREEETTEIEDDGQKKGFFSRLLENKEKSNKDEA